MECFVKPKLVKFVVYQSSEVKIEKPQLLLKVAEFGNTRFPKEGQRSF